MTRTDLVVLELYRELTNVDFLKLNPEARGKSKLVASVIYWDATGQFAVKTFNDAELPLDILEQLIVETKMLVCPGYFKSV